MYEELSASLDKPVYNAAMKKTMALFSSCKNTSAWDPVNSLEYQECTNKISSSSLLVGTNMENIENFVANRNGNLSIQAELAQVFQDVELDQHPAKRLNHAIDYIRNNSMVLNQTSSCLEVTDCLKTIREVVIRLKMIDWGVFGIGATGFGLHLANHQNMLGPYFSDFDGNEWPHVPLNKEPTPLEVNLNHILTNLTLKMSNHTLKNVSLLDLPAFGSSIVTLRKELKKQFIWPIKTNFAILKANPELDRKTISIAYKTLMDDWADYMEQLNKKNDANYFTLDMKKNNYLNFTKYIHEDMRTFLTSIAGIALR